MSFDTDQLEVVADLSRDLSNLGPDPSPVRHTIAECPHAAGRSRKDVHIDVRSVTFASSGDDEASARRRLCRTQTPYWPRSESPCSTSVSDTSFDEATEDSIADDFMEDEEDGETECELCLKEAAEAEEKAKAEAEKDSENTEHQSEGVDNLGDPTTKVAPSPRSSPSAKRAFLSKKGTKFNSTIDKEES